VRLCKIIDLDGAGLFGGSGRKYVKRCVEISQQHYPELLGNVYIVNAPWIYTAVLY